MRKRHRDRSFLRQREEDILKYLTTGDILMSSMLSGRSTRAFYREAYKRARARYLDKRSLEGLKKKGLVTQHGEMLRISDKGQGLLEILASRATRADTAWKGHWWVVMYDIPVSANSFRFELRNILIRSGYRKLQHSVWVHPHACKELEIFLTNNPRMNEFVNYVELLPFIHLKTIDDWKKLPTT